MKSPQHMNIIEIDNTNVCDKHCSNCTRLCGHHKKLFFMDFDTFKRAVDSLDGFQGSRNIMGGEPTLHPEFERFVRYLASNFPERKDLLVAPQKDFIKAVHRAEAAVYQLLDDGPERLRVIGPGLCSNMGASYRKHYELRWASPTRTGPPSWTPAGFKTSGALVLRRRALFPDKRRYEEPSSKRPCEPLLSPVCVCYPQGNSALFVHDFTTASILDGPSFGAELNKLLAEKNDWVVLHSTNAKLAGDFAEQIGKYVLNPGTLHYITERQNALRSAA